jgi:hypothetical protein
LLGGTQIPQYASSIFNLSIFIFIFISNNLITCCCLLLAAICFALICFGELRCVRRCGRGLFLLSAF